MGGSEEGLLIELKWLGMVYHYEMLLDALSEAGGANSMIGRYSINDIIRHRLTKLFKTNPPESIVCIFAKVSR